MADEPGIQRNTYCPRFHFAVELLGQRWTAVVLRVLARGPARFGQIRRQIPGLSDRLLAKRLSELVDSGIVRRCEQDGDACYGLSERGRKIMLALDAIDAVKYDIAPVDTPVATAR